MKQLVEIVNRQVNNVSEWLISAARVAAYSGNPVLLGEKPPASLEYTFHDPTSQNSRPISVERFHELLAGQFVVDRMSIANETSFREVATIIEEGGTPRLDGSTTRLPFLSTDIAETDLALELMLEGVNPVMTQWRVVPLQQPTVTSIRMRKRI